MPLLRLTDINIAFGTHALLNRENLQLDMAERVGLLGRNGEGKSTLMKIIAGEIKPDSGTVWLQPSIRVAWLEQNPNLPEHSTIYDAVANGLGEIGELISRYHHLSVEPHHHDDNYLRQLGNIQQQLEARDGWQFHNKIEAILTKLDLSPDVTVASLSGGWRRRVALAKALVVEPHILLLDEPTNHLDITSIAWLEEQLLNFPGAVLFVTHDRAFLQRLATRIVDLDRGNLVSWLGNYDDYLRRKAATLADEINQNAEFDKKLAQEETWIRQGIKARRTRNEGRVRRLEKLRQERTLRRNQQGSSKLTLASSEQSGKKVIEAIDISFAYADNSIDDNIIQSFSTLIQRGDKVGLIGGNGSGKTTLLKLLLKQIQPNSGEIIHGTRLEIAYFDQLRAQLNPETTVVDAVAEGNDFIEIGGNKRHIMSYLADFLFAPARARSPIKSLSGGEKNRLLLARLFTKPANVLVMDEPTNDLDLETLELLEAKLVEYDGTLLLVSHDRAFLDNVVTSVFVLDGTGKVEKYVGGYSDWQRHKQSVNEISARSVKIGTLTNQVQEQTQPAKAIDNKKKLNYKEQRELNDLPMQIEKLEQRQQLLTTTINQVEFYKKEQNTVQQTLAELQTIEQQLQQAYQRWEYLDELQTALGG